MKTGSSARWYFYLLRRQVRALIILALVLLIELTRLQRILANDINTNVFLDLISRILSGGWETGDVRVVIIIARYDKHFLPRLWVKHRREVLVS